MSVDDWITSATDDQLLNKRSEYAAQRFAFSGHRDSDIVHKLIADLDREIAKRGLSVQS